nr:MAG TPA: hypothetical protein [Bacteriophage sp.]
MILLPEVAENSLHQKEKKRGKSIHKQKRR